MSVVEFKPKITQLMYLAGPYSDTDPLVKEIRYHALLKAESFLIHEGYLIYSPIGACHELSKIYDLPTGYNFWQKRDREFISRCDGVIVLTLKGWHTSIGVTDEVAFAKIKKIPVQYLHPVKDKLNKRGYILSNCEVLT